MNIDVLHRQLHACGFTGAKIRLSLDDEEEDIIEINDKIHVQVGYYGDARVVKELHGMADFDFLLYPDRTTVKALVDDIRNAMDNK